MKSFSSTNNTANTENTYKNTNASLEISIIVLDICVPTVKDRVPTNERYASAFISKLWTIQDSMYISPVDAPAPTRVICETA